MKSQDKKYTLYCHKPQHLIKRFSHFVVKISIKLYTFNKKKIYWCHKYGL